MSTSLALLVAYVLLNVGLSVDWGFYNPLALVLLLMSFALVVVAFVRAVRGDTRDQSAPSVASFAVGLLALLLVSAQVPTGMYLQTDLVDRLYHGWVVFLASLVVAVYLVFRHRGEWLRQWVFVVAVIVALAFRIWMPIASPSPVIDVYRMGQESSQQLLEGKNPYSTPITDVYRQFGEGPEYGFEGYVYLPANLFIQTISYRLTGDVRYSSVLAEIVVAFALWRLARRRWAASIAELMVLLFLYAPHSLFMIEQAWLDTLILMFFALFLLLRDRGRPTLASVAYGYMLFLKQYMVFAFAQWFIIERNWKRIVTGLAVGVLTILPFAIADWRAFLRNGILFNVLVFRAGSLTVSGFLEQRWGLQPPFGWTILVGAVLTVVTFLPQARIQPLRGYLFAVTITTFGMFLFGSSGFYNWYYLVTGEVLFLLVLGGRSEGLASTNTLSSVDAVPSLPNTEG